jgi:hypothetical protein
MTNPEYHNLNLAINNLYETFERYPVPKWFNCSAKDKEAKKACLRQITKKMIVDFNFSDSFDQISYMSPKHYKGLLPRILEFIAHEGYVLDSLSRLTLNSVFKERKHFIRNEWAAVENYLTGLWKSILSTRPDTTETLLPDEYLRDIGEYEAIQPYLKIWENQLHQETAVIHLAHLILQGVEPFYAEKDSKNAQTMEAWLIKPKMHKVLESAFWANSDDEELGILFSGAVDMYSTRVSNYQSIS